jgi:transcriptional antiterminator NusG
MQRNSEEANAGMEGNALTEAQAVVPAEAIATPKQWYIVHTYSGFEKKVKESLEGRVAAFGLTDKIGQIIIPTESVVEVRKR